MTIRKLKTYAITVVEVLLHRTTVKADGIVAANERARDRWDENGPEAFRTETLGRADLIIADEEVRS